MLNLFVLGLIPGTNLQITFLWFIVAGIIVDMIIGFFYIRYLAHHYRHLSVDQENTDSDNQLALFN